jgi:hypothetical protein
LIHQLNQEKEINERRNGRNGENGRREMRCEGWEGEDDDGIVNSSGYNEQCRDE